MWDYVPYKVDMCSGAPEPLDNSSLMFVQPSNFSLQMGSQVKKALFYEYTDATFATRVVGLWCRTSSLYLARLSMQAFTLHKKQYRTLVRMQRIFRGKKTIWRYLHGAQRSHPAQLHSNQCLKLPINLWFKCHGSPVLWWPLWQPGIDRVCLSCCSLQTPPWGTWGRRCAQRWGTQSRLCSRTCAASPPASTPTECSTPRTLRERPTTTGPVVSSTPAGCHCFCPGSRDASAAATQKVTCSGRLPLRVETG